MGDGHGDWWYDKITVVTGGWRPSWVIFFGVFWCWKMVSNRTILWWEIISVRSHPHTPGRYPGRFTNSLWRNFFVWGSLGYLPRGPVGKIMESGFAWFPYMYWVGSTLELPRPELQDANGQEENHESLSHASPSLSFQKVGSLFLAKFFDSWTYLHTSYYAPFVDSSKTIRLHQLRSNHVRTSQGRNCQIKNVEKHTIHRFLDVWGGPYRSTVTQTYKKKKTWNEKINLLRQPSGIFAWKSPILKLTSLLSWHHMTFNPKMAGLFGWSSQFVFNFQVIQFVTFLGWLSDLFERLSDLQLGDKKATLNHQVEGDFQSSLVFCGSAQPLNLPMMVSDRLPRLPTSGPSRGKINSTYRDCNPSYPIIRPFMGVMTPCITIVGAHLVDTAAQLLGAKLFSRPSGIFVAGNDWHLGLESWRNRNRLLLLY